MRCSTWPARRRDEPARACPPWRPLGAPLAAALLSVVAFRRSAPAGAPAAVLTVVSSVLATGAAAGPAARSARRGPCLRATVPWMVVQGRGAGRDRRAPRRRLGADAGGGVPGGAGSPGLLARYLHGGAPRSYGRYFTYHALFLFSMNTLVLAPELLQAFAGWELVGLLSYLLIGFHVEPPDRRAGRGQGVLDDQARRHGVPLRPAAALRPHRELRLGRGAAASAWRRPSPRCSSWR